MVTGDRMAKILKFRPMEFSRSESGDDMRTHASAEVIVFPGVRYERWDDSADAESGATSAAKREARGQRRDVLDLVE